VVGENSADTEQWQIYFHDMTTFGYYEVQFPETTIVITSKKCQENQVCVKKRGASGADQPACGNNAATVGVARKDAGTKIAYVR